MLQRKQILQSMHCFNLYDQNKRSLNLKSFCIPKSRCCKTIYITVYIDRVYVQAFTFSVNDLLTSMSCDVFSSKAFQEPFILKKL